MDYIVAESLAQRHPTLRAQVANSHSHFRSRLNAANARTRLMPGGPAPRAIRALQVAPNEDSSDPVPPADTTVPDDAEDTGDRGYRQHSIHLLQDDDDDDDFEQYFSALSLQAVHVCRGTDDTTSASAETVSLPPLHSDDPSVIRRLAETYDAATTSTYAHADNGSMACTANDASLLFAYRPLVNSQVRLLDAGDHIHRPLGVGFLGIPTENHEIGGGQQFVFIRTYHTSTIPGVII